MIREKETTLYLGPQHPGITGNMMIKLKVQGDTVVSATTHVGYLHRAFEKLIERRNWLNAFTLLCRFCVPEPDPMELTYARAVEELDNREVPERAKYIRVIVMELARLQSFLLWYAGQAGSGGLYTMGQWSVGDRNYVLDLFEDLTGGRIYHMYIWPGGVRRDLPEGWTDKVLKTMDYLENRQINPMLATEYAAQALQLATEQKDSVQMAVSLNYLGDCYFSRKSFFTGRHCSPCSPPPVTSTCTWG